MGYSHIKAERVCAAVKLKFLIYINDLPDELSSQVRLFADDTAVYLTIGGAEDGKLLQKDLDRLSVWEDRWDMEFNPSKCQVVRVTSSRIPFNFSYTLHGQVLEVVTSAKYLGVDISCISSGLSWNPHIDRISKTATRTLNFIQRNIKTKNQKVRETAYNTLVRPQLEYAVMYDSYLLKDVHSVLVNFPREYAQESMIYTYDVCLLSLAIIYF